MKQRGSKPSLKKGIFLSTSILSLCFFALSPSTTIRIYDQALSIGIAAVLEPVSHLTRLGWGICQMTPWASTIGNELFLLSHLCGSAAQKVFAQIFKDPPAPNQLPFFEAALPSHSSWHLNKMLFSQISASSLQEEKLLLFLQRRWLAKSTGFYPFLVDWTCPRFGVCLQIHPETTSAYARNPCNKLSETYEKTVKIWKKSLPHPDHFPLILTRPADLHEYFPAYLKIVKSDEIQNSVEKLIPMLSAPDSRVIVDFTEALSNQGTWPDAWAELRLSFLQRCEELQLDLNRIICIEKGELEHLGGIRILPLQAHFADKSESHFQFLLEWISRFGLTANRVELDRSFLFPAARNDGSKRPAGLPLAQFRAALQTFELNWNEGKPYETLMVNGALQVLKELTACLDENEIGNSPIKSSIAELCFLKLQDRLMGLTKISDQVLFFDMMEQIHAEISTLVAIVSPFSLNDFSKIYRDLLTIPAKLQPLASFSIHSSGMSSLAGIFKAVRGSIGKTPRVLYGENTYFECILAAEAISHAIAIEEATEEDFSQADLLLAQFNPVLKRIDLQQTEYRVEKIAAPLHRALAMKRSKPLTLALDCTMDYIDSTRVARLLEEFQEEIEEGGLNVVCYRSGLKFDLFGMDNYCGAPFYMVHKQGPEWAQFDSLLNDPVLVTDSLSLNWFCLAYQSAADQLDLYRKQIFDNTRALLDRIPPRLFSEHSKYRVIPVQRSADAAFIDIKIYAPLHTLRGSLLAGGCLYYKSMEAGLPIFFRPSLGLYHPNISMIFGENCTTIRLTLGIDPAQIEILAKCLKMIDALNGSPYSSLKKLADNSAK